MSAENESVLKRQNSLKVSVLKRLLFRPIIKHPSLQSLWSRLHTLTVFAMNYGGGGLIETSGERWVLTHVITKLLRHISKPTVFDVGANVGDYSLIIRDVLPAATVFAFEPSTPVYDDLKARVADYSDKIKPFNIGFSDSQKTAVLHSYTADGAPASVLASIDPRLSTQVVDVSLASTEQIEVTTIDSFCESQGISHIHFLKLDVEGHELPILNGAQRMLAQDSISAIQFEFGPANIYSRTYFYNFWSLLSERFDIFRIIPEGIVPIVWYGEHREIFLTTNYLAMRKDIAGSLAS